MRDWTQLPELRQYEDKKVVEENIKDKSKMFDNTNIKKSFRMVIIGIISILILFVLEYINSSFELQGTLRLLMFFTMFIFIVLGFLLFYGIYYLILGYIVNINSYIEDKKNYK